MNPPQSVSAVCGMVAWQAPSVEDYKLITGYDVHISLLRNNILNEPFVVSKNYNQLYHRIFQDSTFPYRANQNFLASIKVNIHNMEAVILLAVTCHKINIHCFSY